MVSHDTITVRGLWGGRGEVQRAEWTCEKILITQRLDQTSAVNARRDMSEPADNMCVCVCVHCTLLYVRAHIVASINIICVVL